MGIVREFEAVGVGEASEVGAVVGGMELLSAQTCVVEVYGEKGSTVSL